VTSSNDEGSRRAGSERCSECGAALAATQRYCLECGARRAPLPAVVADRVAALAERGRPAAPEASPIRIAPADPVAAPPAPAESEEAEGDAGRWSFMPSPQVAAVAVMALLAAGVVIGSVTSPAQSASFAPIVLEMAESATPESEPETVASEPSVAAEPATASLSEEPLAPPTETPAAAPEGEAAPQLPPELPEEETLPEIKHVFLIVLDGHGYEEAFGRASTSPYFARALPAQGELLPNYYAVAQGGLANRIALLSGQGPTLQTVAGCPEYAPIAPGTLSAEGQVEGSGCGYPAATPTLPGQLAEKGLSWRAYVEGGGGCAEEPRRDPLLYFAALAEGPSCGEDAVGIERLGADLGSARTTPALSYIVPGPCHDGSETPCAPEQPAGLAGAETFLQTTLPQITASPAYREGGLIAIAFDQAPQEGPNADSSSCCATPEYPNLPPPATPAAPASGPVRESGGGGRVGLLLISPFVKAGSVDEAGYYNHFALLLSIEEAFGLEPLGYAADPALTAFDSTVYNAESSESSTGPAAGSSGVRPARARAPRRSR
jgi:phosphatidylinositol-3-phosphatase